MDKIEKQRVHFEGISERYYVSRQAKSHLLLKHLIWSHFFYDKDFLKKEGMLVLEPMCGYAEGKRIVEEHLCKDFRYEGFDYSETLVETIKKREPGINVMKMDINRFKPAKKYDLVFLIGGLHHVPDYTKKITETISEALVDGGFFINFEPTQNNFIIKRVRERIYKKNSLFDSETERAFDLEDLNDIYLSSNFKIIDQIYPGLLSYVLYYNPDAFPLLNIGGASAVKFLFGIDRLFFRNLIGRNFSFATLTLLQKVKN